MDDYPSSKVCTGCTEDKPLEDYYRHKKGKYGRQQKCKPCKKSQDAQYYKENSEDINTRVNKYQDDNPDKVKASQHNKYMKRREEIIANNKEWVGKNSEKVKGYKRAYQARLEGLKKSQDHNPDYSKVLEHDGYVCYLCQTDVEQGDHQHDHIVPITKDGAHAEFNISIAHSTCNIRKQATLPEDLPEPQRTNALNKLEELKKGTENKLGTLKQFN